jgi:hypothetical protein
MDNLIITRLLVLEFLFGVDDVDGRIIMVISGIEPFSILRTLSIPSVSRYLVFLDNSESFSA